MILSKDKLRSQIASFRMSLDNEEYLKKSNIILNKLINSQWYLEADTIISYVSVNNEVDTIGLINRALSDGKRVAVPKIINKEMEFYYINSLSELKKGYFNIPEPIDTSNICMPRSQEESDMSDIFNMVMIVPGVAFDRSNNRLGYGGGFYDRYLSIHKIYTIAICFKEQLLDEICTEEYDIKMDEVITD